jgi:hypothetical protein
MNKKQFEKIFGNQEIKVAKNYVTKSVATNYTKFDSVAEAVDNSIDAKEGEEVNVHIDCNDEKHTLTFTDDGKGIEDFENLFTLGGTNKENLSGKIGKFGIGFKGAIAKIAMQCRFNKKDGVLVNVESKRLGKKTNLSILIDVDGSTTIGNVYTSDCDKSLHGTQIVFENVDFKEMAELQDFLEETYEFTMKEHGLNIYINNRKLGQTGNQKQTLSGEETPKCLKVGKHNVKVMYRIIGGDRRSYGKKDIERSFSEAALRIYDKTSGRLLAKDNKLWKWYINKEAQQAICGLRCAIFIDGNIDSYNEFGIKSTKNGVNFRQYHKKEEFKELCDHLTTIYQKVMGDKVGRNAIYNVEAKNGSNRIYEVRDKVMGQDNLPYIVVNDEQIIMAKKWQPKDIATLIDMYINLKNEIDKRKAA